MGGPSSVSAEQEMGVDPWLYLIDVNPRAEAVAWVYETSQTEGLPARYGFRAVRRQSSARPAR